MRPRCPSTSPRRLGPVALLVGALLVAGCATGPRPYFADDSETTVAAATGDAGIDAVLGLLDSADDGQYTATYRVVRLFDPVETTATVVVDGSGRRSVTVGSSADGLRFITDESGDRTCDLSTAVCRSGLDVQMVSNSTLTIGFYGPDIATRLRNDAEARLATSEPYTKPIADQNAQCVDVTVSGNNVKTYCALSSGAAAAFVGADYTIDLTAYSSIPDQSAFSA